MVDRFFNSFIMFIICIVPLIITPWSKDYYYHPKIFSIYITSFVLSVVYLIFAKKSKVNNKPIDYIIIAYLVLVCLSTIFSIDAHQSFLGRAFREEGLFAICCYIFIFQLSSKYYKFSYSHVNFVLLSSVIVSLYATSQYFGFDPVPVDPMRKIWNNYAYSTTGNPNFLGSYLTLILPISIFCYLYTKKLSYALISSFLFLALLCTRTRSSWTGFIISLTLLGYTCYKIKYNFKPLAKLIGVFLIIFLSLNFYSQNDTAKRLNTIVKDVKSVATLSSGYEYAGSKRIFIWKNAVKLIPQRVLIGYGPDTFDIAFMGSFSQETERYFGRLIIDKAHNEYIQIAVSTGIPSLLLYLAALTTLLLRALKRTKKNILVIPLFCSITGYLVQAFFNISVVSVAPVYWALLGILNNLSEPD
jgi:O-antigen ligase